MKGKLFVLLATLLSTVIVLVGCSPPEDDPENIVRQYFEAIISKDIDVAYDMLKGSYVPEKERFKASIERHSVTEYKIVDSKPAGNEKYAVHIQFKIRGKQGKDISNETTLIVGKTDSKWSILFENTPHQ